MSLFPSSQITKTINMIDAIVIHHTASPRDKTTVAAVNEFHKTKDWDSGNGVARASRSSLGWFVQYHYFIEASGKVTQCAKDEELRWHAGPQANGRSVSICLAGWFDDGHDDMPTEKQKESLKKVLNEVAGRHNIKPENVFGHRHFMKKTCPGMHITDEWIRSLLREDFGKQFAGKLLLGVEDHGSVWYVTTDGKRVKIGRTPEEISAFLKAINDRYVPVVGITNNDLSKIQNV